MSFEEAIKGVPLELVRQGWRLEPSQSVMEAWDDERTAPLYRWRGWQSMWCHGTDSTRLQVWRPVTSEQFRQVAATYAHTGWGDGLSPTPEMVKVWAFWWYKAASEPQPHVVEVFQCDEALKYVSARMHERPISQARGEWRGPVLPPMEGI